MRCYKSNGIVAIHNVAVYSLIYFPVGRYIRGKDDDERDIGERPDAKLLVSKFIRFRISAYTL